MSVVITDAVRAASTVVVGPPGCGKTRILSRQLVYHDFLAGISGVFFDPVGEGYNNLFDKIARLPKRQRERLWRRIVYVNVAGKYGHVKADPLYYRQGFESLYEVAQRFVNVIARTDQSLRQASIQGFNAFAEIATNVGMAAFACGVQIDETFALLNNLKAWQGRLQKAAAEQPEAQPAVDYLLNRYEKLPQREKQTQAMTFFRKTAMFRLDPAMRTQFCSTPPTINWEAVAQGKKLVILDFSGIPDRERRIFCVVWTFRQLLEYVMSRGSAKRSPPFAITIDELNYIVGQESGQNDPLADDLQDLIARLARNANIWLTISLQSLDQLSLAMQRVVWLCGTFVFGSTKDLDFAIDVAKKWREFDPDLVRKTELRERALPGRSYGSHEIITDVHTTEFSMHEQWYLHARKQMTLPRFHFLVATPSVEGNSALNLQRIDSTNLDRGIFPDRTVTDRIARALAKRSGIPISKPAETIFYDDPPPRVA
jgi:hypothetical protein